VTVAWLDASAGASGDMLLGALVGAGADLAVLQAAVDALGTEPVRLTAGPVTRSGLAATQVEVAAPTSDVRRTWPDIRALIEGADLADPVRDLALDVFARLARAEAAAHGIPADDVHFHEVGALDSLADVVGVCAALHDLAVTEVHCTPVALGQGSVRTEHGLLPVPGPAVLAVLAEVGAPVGAGDVEGEACTPTGAALLAATVTGWGGLPGLRVSTTGTGAGSRDTAGRPNVLRVVLGEPTTSGLEAGDAVGAVGAVDAVVLAANVDDLDPRVWPGVLAALLAAGAVDAWLTPILMKKGRPAHTLSALAPPHAADAVRRVMFTESSTIGVREHRVAKQALARETRTVRVGGAEVRVKVASLDGQVVNVSPEYDDVAAAAVALGRPVKAVLAAAAAAVHADLG
jgi:pyridinium-3,5-bisthiocarboxylic acid mononucleotide nickel chelatase